MVSTMSIKLLDCWVLEALPTEYHSPGAVILSPPVRMDEAEGLYRSLHPNLVHALSALRRLKRRGGSKRLRLLADLNRR